MRGFLLVSLVPVFVGCATPSTSSPTDTSAIESRECRAECSILFTQVPACMKQKPSIRELTQILRPMFEELEAVDMLNDSVCGCLTMQLSPAGNFENINVVYASAPNVAAEFSSVFSNQSLSLSDSKFDFVGCISDTKIPMFFGTGFPNQDLSNGRPHAIHPTYELIASDSLTEVSGILADHEIGWSSLNVKFGIIYDGQNRYLAEASRYCLPIEDKVDISIEGKVRRGGLVSASRIRINKCALLSLFPITNEQALELKRISNDEYELK